MFAQTHVREVDFDVSMQPSLSIREDATGSLCGGGVGNTIWDAALVLIKWLEYRIQQEMINAQVFIKDGSPWKKEWMSTFPRFTQTEKKGLNILELGSGTGVAGLGFSRLISNANIIVTDKASCLPLLTENVQLNEKKGNDSPNSISVNLFDWNDSIPCFKLLQNRGTDTSNLTIAQKSLIHLACKAWDLVIFSDLIWWKDLYDSLITSLLLVTHQNPDCYIIFSYEIRNFQEEVDFFRQLGEHFTFFNVPKEEMHPDWQAEEIPIFIGKRKF